MTRNPPVHGLAHPVVRVAACEDPPMDLHDWATACAQAMRTGQRMLTLYGRRVSADQALVTAVLLREPGGMAILRGRGPIAQGYPSLTAEFPSEGVNESGVMSGHAGFVHTFSVRTDVGRSHPDPYAPFVAGSPHPVRAELVEAPHPWCRHFDRLSANGWGRPVGHSPPA